MAPITAPPRPATTACPTAAITRAMPRTSALYQIAGFASCRITKPTVTAATQAANGELAKDLLGPSHAVLASSRTLPSLRRTDQRQQVLSCDDWGFFEPC